MKQGVSCTPDTAHHTHHTLRTVASIKKKHSPVLGETVPSRKSPAAVDVKKSTKTPPGKGEREGAGEGARGGEGARSEGDVRVRVRLVQ